MFGMAMKFLACAAALFVAVRLIEAVAPELILIGIGTALGYLAWTVHRRQRSGW
jgi:hypothetical protein